MESINKNISMSIVDNAAGQSFVLNFAAVTILSGGNIAAGVFAGGSCALASVISGVTTPIFMSVLGYAKDDKTSFTARLANSLMVLGIHGFMLGTLRVKTVNYLAVAAIACFVAYREKNSDAHFPQVYGKLETLLVQEAWKFGRGLFATR